MEFFFNKYVSGKLKTKINTNMLFLYLVTLIKVKYVKN